MLSLASSSSSTFLNMWKWSRFQIVRTMRCQPSCKRLDSNVYGGLEFTTSMVWLCHLPVPEWPNIRWSTPFACVNSSSPCVPVIGTGCFLLSGLKSPPNVSLFRLVWRTIKPKHTLIRAGGALGKTYLGLFQTDRFNVLSLDTLDLLTIWSVSLCCTLSP